MRFAVQIPVENVEAPDEFLTAQAIGEMAHAAEAAGFDAGFVTDHPIPDARFVEHGGHHSLDPFVALAFAAAATTRLRLLTNAVVLPYRNPFLTAKAAATLDVASGGRLVLGVASGYLASEFAALGVPFEERNARSDEALRAIDQVFRGEPFELSGLAFEAKRQVALPRPVQRPRPPIWVGGNSRRAIRRAVELGDGWMPFPAAPGLAGAIRTAALPDLAALEAGLAHARDHAAEVGRSAPLEVCFVPFGFDFGAREAPDPAVFAEQLAQLEALGVGWLA